MEKPHTLSEARDQIAATEQQLGGVCLRSVAEAIDGRSILPPLTEAGKPTAGNDVQIIEQLTGAVERGGESLLRDGRSFNRCDVPGCYVACEFYVVPLSKIAATDGVGQGLSPAAVCTPEQ